MHQHNLQLEMPQVDGGDQSGPDHLLCEPGRMLFGNEFMKNATEHWEQVKALQKMQGRPVTSGFQKAYS